MKRLISTLLVLLMLLSALALGEEAAPAALPADNLVQTHHTAVIDGKEVNYTATAGTIAMETAQGQYEMFFTAYTLDGTEDYSDRPITFAFNGGPGSASLWLHMGLLGPQRIALNEEGMIERIPVGSRANEYSILDMTDLVFIDPVGTGYSRALPGTDAAPFYTYNGDIKSVGDFIRLYVSRYGRWASPKFLAGESYGTTRAIGLCDYLLNEHHLNLNGIMLVSSVNDFGTIVRTAGNEMPFVNYLPSFAAVAWYHKKADAKYLDMELEDYLTEVKAFASGDYLSALYQGTRLTEAERDAIAARLAAYIGLDKDFILKHNLRVSLEDFCKELLSDDRLMVGRYDGRYTGPVIDGSLEDGTSDPSSVGITEAFTGLYNDYVARVLNYKTDRPYVTLSLEVNVRWSFERDNAVLTQEDTIRNCLSSNQQMKIWVLCGYYDLATPFYAAEWVYSHTFVNDALRDNVSFTHYPAGHMFYLLDANVSRFREDAKAWYQKAR